MTGDDKVASRGLVLGMSCPEFCPDTSVHDGTSTGRGLSP